MMAQMPKYIVFTDASMRRGQGTGARSYCGYGVVILNTETRQYTEFGAELGGNTVAFGEAWAIYRGIQKARDLIHDNEETSILVVTDSKLNVQILSVYIPYVWDTTDENNWKKKDGLPVRNQDVYKRIVHMLEDNPHMKVRITHINSHLSQKEWPRTKKKLEKYGIIADSKTAQMFMEMNGRADEIAQSITKRMKEEEEKYGCFIRLEPVKKEEDE